jgi:branched-chain amino acid transport system ATP-binding protein
VKNSAKLLKVDGISAAYGRAEVIKNVSIQVNEGEFIVLLGANGSGKSTTLKTILGVKRPTQGSIKFLGRDMKGMSVARTVGMGMALIPEGRGIIPAMTVEENLELGAFHRKDDITPSLNAVFDRFPILRERRIQMAGTLSGGQQQMLAIARAMLASPKLLMLDEPSLGLAPIVVTELFRTIVDLKSNGFTILMAEQNVRKALNAADRGYVFDTGRIVLTGTAEELRENERLRQAYLG